MHLIGLNGFKTSGKDTTFTVIQNLYGDGEANVERAAFADRLKRMAALALGFDEDQGDLVELMDQCKETWEITIWDSPTVAAPFHGLTGREYLQNFGNHARTLFGENFWIDAVLPNPASLFDSRDREESLAEAYPDANCVVVTDVRYANEAQRVQDLGGVVWEIVRPSVKSDGHASELPLPRELVDFTINNPYDGTNDYAALAYLEGEVYAAMNETLC
jgi:hypothetical protein